MPSSLNFWVGKGAISFRFHSSSEEIQKIRCIRCWLDESFGLVYSSLLGRCRHRGLDCRDCGFYRRVVRSNAMAVVSDILRDHNLER